MKDVLASFIFLTRLPFWRICEVPAECFKHVVAYWPLVGWLTGGVMAGMLWVSAQVFPMEVAWVLAILARLLVTGCLHEDGLADFFDGFGGGTSRARTLEIMKDSRIGTYGVVGLVFYFLLLYQVHVLPLDRLCWVCLTGDVFSKFVCSQTVNVLPYARREEDSKAKVVYSRMSVREFLTGLVFGLAPVVVYDLFRTQMTQTGADERSFISLVVPVVVWGLMCMWMRRRIGGYTGDCLGAVFLLSELGFLLFSLWR